jgi:hypothetical protein
MRTIILLTGGLLLFGGLFLYCRLFVQHYPNAPTWASWGFLAAWLAATVFTLLVGVSHAGYSVREQSGVVLLAAAIAYYILSRPSLPSRENAQCCGGRWVAT